ncbi:hypothetical protein HD806DRAFT_474240, partial [Xylariaceae sp. AK1471]
MTASSSTTSAEVNVFLNPKGRMFAAGHCRDVALGGFLPGVSRLPFSTLFSNQDDNI